MNLSLKLKETVYTYCADFIQKRIDQLRESISRVNEAIENESKSSAGDKFETSRAMAQNEKEIISAQLAEALRIKNALTHLSVGRKKSVCSGALVQTEKGNFFISISTPKFDFKGSRIYCIAPNAPLARAMMSKVKGESFQFNRTTQKIIEII